MHACGHDLHMTVALGILANFCEHRPSDQLLFFFQPAEESENGGKLAYEDQLFTGKWRPDEFYGLHDNPQLPAGTIGCRLGTCSLEPRKLTFILQVNKGMQRIRNLRMIW